MSQSKTKTAAEDLMASLMEELKLSADENSNDNKSNGSTYSESTEAVCQDDSSVLTANIRNDQEEELNMASILNTSFEEDLGSSENPAEPALLNLEVPKAIDELYDKTDIKMQDDDFNAKTQIDSPVQSDSIPFSASQVGANDPTVAIATPTNHFGAGDNEKTVAIAGYSQRNDSQNENNVKVSVGQSRAAFSSGYAAWGNSDSQLAQAENLRIAQEKILELENENEKLRLQNEELIAASEIVKERADLLTTQVHEFKNDRDSLEQSFKNEMQLIRNQFHRKDNELQKAQMKIDELDSRLKFDMKKIRIRERELENRLELIRAEKNALVKSKDEQILDLRRKMDQVQLEVESYRQKCVELNKALDVNQDSFKRTTRALRLAMANLELQDENKIPLKKAE
jgi:hypothetical protein